MKVVYASRTGNVESIISKLGIEDALKVEDGSETVEEDYILFTYTDGFGDVPYEVDEFLQSQSEHLKGDVLSGDTMEQIIVKQDMSLLNNIMYHAYIK